MSRDLLVRAAAARLLGRSIPTVRRYERAGLLTPVRVGGARDVHYHLAELEKLRSDIDSRDPRGPDGETYARAFDALENGASPADLVRELRLRPEIVLEMVARWEEMRRTVVRLNADDLGAIAGALDAKDARLATARDVIGLLHSWKSVALLAASVPAKEESPRDNIADDSEVFDFDALRGMADRLLPTVPMWAKALTIAIDGYRQGTSTRGALVNCAQNVAHLLGEPVPEFHVPEEPSAAGTTPANPARTLHINERIGPQKRTGDGST